MQKELLFDIDDIKSKLDALEDGKDVRAYLMEMVGLDKYLRHRKTVMVGEVPINCEVYEAPTANAPVVIFIPGIGTYAEMYTQFLYTLSQQGFTVVGVDLRGHGYSGGERGAYTVDQVQQDIGQVIEYMIPRYGDQIAMYGCSIGSPLALAVAENDVRVKALLCHTLFLAEFPPDAMTKFGWDTLRFTRMFLPDYRVDFRTFVDVNQLVKDNALAHFMEYDDVLMWNYPVRTLASVYSRRCVALRRDIVIPAAVITGEDDELLHESYIRGIIERMETHFDLMVVPKGRHMLPFDNIKELVRLSADWLHKAFY